MARKTVDQPIAMGTGLLALDVILAGGSPIFAAGGTCGNVMAILGWLGWQTMPVARLNGDAAARVVREDLLKFGVRLDWAEQTPSTATPVIIERLRSDGTGEHRFSLRCPNCRAWLPRYQPVPVKAMRELLDRASAPQVFFFDRLSRGALLLAERTAQGGGIVWFEPSKIDDDAMFEEALAIAHVLKYSRERLPDLASIPLRAEGPLLEIETAGAQGLRYRGKGLRAPARWRQVGAVKATGMVDTSGAGDWFTASLIDQMARKGRADFESSLREKEAVLNALFRRAQAASAVACAFAGARGAMYALDRTKFISCVEDRLADRPHALVPSPASSPHHTRDSLCKDCGTAPESWT
jgi:fructokinase